jgi:hypothetical protein
MQALWASSTWEDLLSSRLGCSVVPILLPDLAMARGECFSMVSCRTLQMDGTAGFMTGAQKKRPYWERRKNAVYLQHVHDPIDEAKVVAWFGQSPSFSMISTEHRTGVRRLICYFEELGWKRRLEKILSRQR